MSDDKKTTTMEDTLDQAEQLEAEAKAAPNYSTYTHVFQESFTYKGTTYDKLTFDWTTLSGEDSVSIERELLNRNIATVIPAYTPEYLASMAMRACTYRNDEGFRTVTMDMLYALPLPEFQKICNAARRFLLRSGSRTAAAGSGNNA